MSCAHDETRATHYGHIIMGTVASQITSLTIVYSTVYSDGDQRKHQSSALLAFVWGIHRRPVNSPHIWPVTRKMFPFDDVIMQCVIFIRPVWWCSRHVSLISLYILIDAHTGGWMVGIPWLYKLKIPRVLEKWHPWGAGCIQGIQMCPHWGM